MEKRNVVITGLGVVCAIGNDVASFTKGLKEGKNGISKIESLSVENCQTEKGGEVKNTEALKVGEYGRTLGFAFKALEEAISDSRLAIKDESNVAVIIGTSVGNFEFLESSTYNRIKNDGIKNHEDARNWQKGCLGNIAGAIAEKYGFNGPKLTISTACAAGTNSIAYAYELIRKGYCDVAITGGADSIHSISLTGFSSLMSLTADCPKPFDENRNGLSLGEGSGILILESQEHALKRGVKVYAEVVGYALCNDAYHVTSPDPDGDGAYRGMLKCLEMSGVSPNEVDYINTHGTGTKSNDIAEIKAIRRLFNNTIKPIYISSNKSLFGHCLGAAGSIEAVSTVLSVCHDFVPPTINTRQPIQAESEGIEGKGSINLVLGKMQPAAINYAISNSFAFAGNIATIGFKKHARNY